MGCSTTVSLPCRSLSGDLGLALQFVFQKALRSLGSEEQIAKWDPLCNKLQILATYAQTELGHGEPGLLGAMYRCALHSSRGPIHISLVIDLYI